MYRPILDTRIAASEANGGEPSHRQQIELEIQNARLAEALRSAEILLAIEAGTDRILKLALGRGHVVHDPELL